MRAVPCGIWRRRRNECRVQLSGAPTPRTWQPASHCAEPCAVCTATRTPPSHRAVTRTRTHTHTLSLSHTLSHSHSHSAPSHTSIRHGGDTQRPVVQLWVEEEEEEEEEEEGEEEEEKEEEDTSADVQHGALGRSHFVADGQCELDRPSSADCCLPSGDTSSYLPSSKPPRGDQACTHAHRYAARRHSRGLAVCRCSRRSVGGISSARPPRLALESVAKMDAISARHPWRAWMCSRTSQCRHSYLPYIATCRLDVDGGGGLEFVTYRAHPSQLRRARLLRRVRLRSGDVGYSCALHRLDRAQGGVCREHGQNAAPRTDECASCCGPLPHESHDVRTHARTLSQPPRPRRDWAWAPGSARMRPGRSRTPRSHCGEGPPTQHGMRGTAVCRTPSTAARVPPLLPGTYACTALATPCTSTYQIDIRPLRQVPPDSLHHTCRCGCGD